MNSLPSRGDIWLVDLNPVRGHEQAGRRPCLVISDDTFNHGPAGLVVVLPLTGKSHDVPLRIPIDPSEGGVRTRSHIMPEMMRSVSTHRLHTRWGKVARATMDTIEFHVKALLSL